MLKDKFSLAAISVSLVFIFTFCENQKDKEPFNIFGNSKRTSSYEHLGNFWTGGAFVDIIDCKDKSGFLTFPLALEGNRFITSTYNGHIVFFEHSNVVWENSLAENEYVLTNIVAAPDETCCFITNFRRLVCISSKGEEKWSVNLSDTSKTFSTLLALKDGLYFSSSNLLYKFDFDGNLKWAFELPLVTTPTFTEFPNVGIVLNLTNDSSGRTDTVMLINSKGELIWRRPIENCRLIRYPIVFSNKIFVFGYRYHQQKQEGFLFCLDKNGTEIWSRQYEIVPRFLSISNDGFLYLILYNSGLGETLSAIYKIDQDGNIVKKQFVTGIFHSPLLISQRLIGSILYKGGSPSMIFFDKDLHLWKIINLSKFPSVLNFPAVLQDCTLIFPAISGNFILRIDENPIIKLLPW
ncbi:MAG: PQQ-binding-like beta-propeller repeat protein [Ignavibacteria bacterium]|nr:PQQ-binding-like beta-propeller repeat protein [Ignavibacteria bacterium]